MAKLLIVTQINSSSTGDVLVVLNLDNISSFHIAEQKDCRRIDWCPLDGVGQRIFTLETTLDLHARLYALTK